MCIRDRDSRWLLNIAYMTLGEYPAKVPQKWLIPGLDDPGAVQVKPFTEMAGDLSIAARNRAGGMIVEDFNNDGYLDIVSSAWGLDDPMHYYRSNADGSFTDASKESGLSAFTGGLNMVQADYNNDGNRQDTDKVLPNVKVSLIDSTGKEVTNLAGQKLSLIHI